MRYFGTFPLNDHFQPSVMCMFLTIVHISVKFSCCLYLLLYEYAIVHTWSHDDKSLIQIFELVIHSSELLRNVLSIVQVYVQKNELSSMANDIQIIKQFSPFSSNRSFGLLTTNLYICGIFFFSLSFISDIYLVLFEKDLYVTTVLYYSNWIFLASTIGQFVSFANEISFLYQKIGKPYNISHTLNMFVEIASICEKFIEIYEFQILFLLFWVYMYTIHYTFVYILILKEPLVLPHSVVFTYSNAIFFHTSYTAWLVSIAIIVECLFAAVSLVKYEVSSNVIIYN